MNPVDFLRELELRLPDAARPVIHDVATQILVERSHQEGFEAGCASGFEKGLEQGLRQGEEIGIYRALIDAAALILETRFDTPPAGLRCHLESLRSQKNPDLALARALVQRCATAPMVDTVVRYLARLEAES